jgi:hypothetical protein
MSGQESTVYAADQQAVQINQTRSNQVGTKWASVPVFEAAPRIQETITYVPKPYPVEKIVERVVQVEKIVPVEGPQRVVQTEGPVEYVEVPGPVEYVEGPTRVVEREKLVPIYRDDPAVRIRLNLCKICLANNKEALAALSRSQGGRLTLGPKKQFNDGKYDWATYKRHQNEVAKEQAAKGQAVAVPPAPPAPAAFNPPPAYPYNY